jgi:hypothetical protein
VTGNTLAGTWDEAPTRTGPADAGPFEFTLTGDLRSFEGKWRHESDGDWYPGGWSGACTAGPCLQNGAGAPGRPQPVPTGPTAPAPLPVTPRSQSPQVGVLTSYAAPKPLGVVALAVPVLGASVAQVSGEVSLARENRAKIDDADFTFGIQPSHANVQRAARLCFLMLFAESRTDTAIDWGTRIEGCVKVVARVLQRAEELRKRRPPASAGPAQAGRCRVVAVPLRGHRGRSPLKVGCARTASGMRVTIRTRTRGRSLNAVLGDSAELIVGRSRRVPARPGDRVNVLWQTGSR